MIWQNRDKYVLQRQGSISTRKIRYSLPEYVLSVRCRVFKTMSTCNLIQNLFLPAPKRKKKGEQGAKTFKKKHALSPQPFLRSHWWKVSQYFLCRLCLFETFRDKDFEIPWSNEKGEAQSLQSMCKIQSSQHGESTTRVFILLDHIISEHWWSLEVQNPITQSVDHTSYTWILASASASFSSSSVGNIISHPEHGISKHGMQWFNSFPPLGEKTSRDLGKRNSSTCNSKLWCNRVWRFVSLSNW